ncbi:SNF2 family N-terminal domain-containing protein [Hypoxylon trugodes]|uniref:SNF2 family N-terminal domain-containing protein n=1 Tax=Hypoxylon trugodes TaxID=326681 RepID=UPI0021A1235B|nr:SNF2 family N-terminal domain-containing protein [Hypoxylon trugodes]KAI1391611.1 SNF2 family N-terminal domain-containing protein [Hypoxylon trugodes]
MPPYLLATWQNELSKHLRSSSYNWRVHHGATRIKDITQVNSVDIVLTTYPILANESAKDPSGVLFSCKWHRVVLDEAHGIKSLTTKTAKAAYRLKADRRWVVTGTPIQNHVSELGSLLSFLGVFPYSDPETFKEQIIRPWKAGKTELVFERLKCLLNFVMLRRSQDLISLPQRTDLKIFLKLGESERRTYDEIKGQVLRCIDDLVFDTMTREEKMNALQKINSLRLICTVGVSGSHKTSSLALADFSTDTTWDENAALGGLRRLPLLGVPVACQICDDLLDISDESASVYLTECLQVCCLCCYDNLRSNFSLTSVSHCECFSPCPTIKVPLNRISSPPIEDIRYGQNFRFPTKIHSLLSDLKENGRNVKSLVFSYWKSTLDLANSALDQSGIRCIQVDGRTKAKDRSAKFKQFTEREDISVLLLSLSCGSTGLTLTAASRAYLMEPQWNPSIEEQALARIYRIGQTKEVENIRFIMEDTIEKYVENVQDNKKDLVTLLLSGSSQSITEQRLQELRNAL